MSAWLFTFKLKDLLSHEDVDDDLAVSLGKEVANRLRHQRALPARFIARFEGVKNQDDFNDVLNQLYDIADARRVWIE